MNDVTREDIDRLYDKLNAVRLELSHALGEMQKEFASQQKALTSLVTTMNMHDRAGFAQPCMQHEIQLGKLADRVTLVELWKSRVGGIVAGVSLASSVTTGLVIAFAQYALGKM